MRMWKSGTTDETQRHVLREHSSQHRDGRVAEWVTRHTTANKDVPVRGPVMTAQAETLLAGYMVHYIEMIQHFKLGWVKKGIEP
jgi:hypothetical protein